MSLVFTVLWLANRPIRNGEIFGMNNVVCGSGFGHMSSVILANFFILFKITFDTYFNVHELIRYIPN